MRILVADPCATFRLQAAQALEAAGHEVALAETGLQAWQMAREASPRAAFVSASLPDMDGLGLAGLWRQAGGAGPRAVVLMADAREAADLRLWSSLTGAVGAPEWLTRPFAAPLLVDVVAAMSHDE